MIMSLDKFDVKQTKPLNNRLKKSTQKTTLPSIYVI